MSYTPLDKKDGDTYKGSKVVTDVKGSADQWDNAAKYVSTANPDNSIGKDGDIWFQYLP